jgi:hypothetical protein
VHPDGPQPSDEVAAASWIGPRLIPGFGALVGRTVPTGDEAYARILHPAADRDGNSVRWTDVARFTGRTVHPLMQWHRLVGAEGTFGEGGIWPGSPPLRGELDQAELAALVDVLQRHTTPVDDCWFCWDVHGLVDATRVTVGDLHYRLARGPVRAALFVGDWTGHQNSFIPEAPALWWPQDRSWCVGSNMDIDSTVVGGAAKLIGEILTDPRLEALPVGPDDSLMYDGDRIN